MTEAQHPTVTELTWSEPDPAIEVHLGMCARCRHLATSRLEFGTSPKMAHAQVPEAVLEALRDPTPSGRPRNGELWRCEWDGTAALVAIVDSSDLDISALAVDTVRPEAAGALAIEGDETELGCPIAIVDAPSVTLPPFTFDRRLGHLPQAYPTVPRAEASWELLGAMDGLVRLATDASQALSSPDSAGTVGQLLRDRGITGRTLADAGIPPRTASLIVQGRHSPTSEQIDIIAVAVDLPRSEIERRLGAPPGRLMAALHAPRNRPLVARRAIDRREPLVRTRRDAARTIAAIARRTAPGTDVDWQSEIEGYFAS
jgi:hypothetical protein